LTATHCAVGRTSLLATAVASQKAALVSSVKGLRVSRYYTPGPYAKCRTRIRSQHSTGQSSRTTLQRPTMSKLPSLRAIDSDRSLSEEVNTLDRSTTNRPRRNILTVFSYSLPISSKKTRAQNLVRLPARPCRRLPNHSTRHGYWSSSVLHHV